MSVFPDNAYRLLHTFGMVEFHLKQPHGFLAAEVNPIRAKRMKAKADWFALDRTVRSLPHEQFLGRVSKKTLRKMLGGKRDRPQMQFFAGRRR